jgi:hypothetical protein
MNHVAHFAVTAKLPDSVAPIAAAMLLLFGAASAHARETGQAEARVAQCIRESAGGRTWLERTLWGLRDQEAGWIGAEVRNTNGTHDLGPLQINSWWVPKIAALIDRPAGDVRGWLQSDPCFNVGTARWIFLSALRTTGDYWRAVGVYHSPTAWRQRRYAMNVARHMQRRFGGEVFSLPRTSLEVTQVRADPGDPTQTASPSIKMHDFGILHDPSS